MTTEPETWSAVLRDEETRRVGDLREPAGRHLEDADLVGRAEPVLHGPEDAVRQTLVALEVEHRVDHVLEDPRPGDRALLGDVADEEDGDTGLLREADERGGRLADLRDAPGRAGDLAREDGLDGIEYEHAGRGRAATSRTCEHVGLGEDDDLRDSTPSRRARILICEPTPRR